ncbi:hypothetical protein [Rudaea sp.]|uniref:hypothetical protein n=1 Tax=Rudaea sp. TaxID=2136325 RepID=UPI002ED6B7D4
MIALLIGLGNLLIGAAYSGLGLLSLWEAISQYRWRGLSRFGPGFSLMAASCGPHHLVHGWHVLREGGVSMPMLEVTLIGLPAGIVFCWLRVEAMFGGRGDRTIVMPLRTLALLATVFFVAVGWLANAALDAPLSTDQAMCTPKGIRYAAAGLFPLTGFVSAGMFSNVFVTVTYSLVGWYLFETQVRRYAAGQQWSLSGLALTAVFPTCAAMHLIHALSFGSHDAMLPFDLLGVFASIYFLWVVRCVYQDAVVDWNRRPQAGVAGVPERASPWSAKDP